MTLQFSLDKNDYLQHQLYIASTSKTIKKKRIKSWLTTTLIFFVLGLFSSQTDNIFLTYYFFIFSIITLIFFPFYQRYRYKKHYQKFINENYKNRFGEEINVSFEEKTIETFDISGELKINHSSLEKITETSSYIFLKVKTGGTLIIPKDKITKKDELKTKLQSLAQKIKIDYSLALDWEWK